MDWAAPIQKIAPKSVLNFLSKNATTSVKVTYSTDFSFMQQMLVFVTNVEKSRIRLDRLAVMKV